MSEQRLLELRGVTQVSARDVVYCPPGLVGGTGTIRCFGFDVWEPHVVRRRKIPGGTVKLVFALDGVFDGRAVHPTALVSGMYDRGSTATHSGRMCSVQVQLGPLAARRLLGVPLHEVRNAVVPLEEILGPSARQLAERLAETRGWQRRFELVGEYLRRLPRAEADDTVVASVRRLRSGRDGLTVSDLVTESGWSRRHFSRRFTDQVGLSPRAYASLLRFSAALRELVAPVPPELGRMAHELGYYDQSHLIRDFQRFAGASPHALLREAMAQSSNTSGAAIA
ncbi:helix-turn-helix transcriptional regulator [Nocardia sp. CDC159]|uniref:Helix-turn-helix transcriptional regulator n=1 Tax=Nocardia pulmonis TaxID=2951408 RepID=A0A9X2ED82_9NOCA|nr:MULTISPECIES: helix-turn-helix transcriptional regulator [Nocardia]MCM6778205.1 helix-turn-helix transcriptional regulator [Nocardia pulmonis]MCM6791094.1 helix-turn-helix transcriptional regulator [Nocardia sp. CDC159]